MKKFYFLFVSLIMTQFSALAQSGWFQQTSVTGETLNSVNFINTNTGWAVGKDGTIIKTTNGGSSWFSQSSGVTNILNDVFIKDENNGAIAAGFITTPGMILRTTNGGDSWYAQFSSDSIKLISITFADVNTGFAVGTNGSILKTTDDGLNWISKTSGTIERLWSVHFIDQNIGWVAGENGTIINTIDGGENWLVQTSGTSYDLLDVLFVDANNGWIIGNGISYPGQATTIFLNTTNGGEEWMIQNWMRGWFYSIHFTSQNYGWAVGVNGLIAYTTNGGAEWSFQYNELTTDLYSVHFADQNNGWVVGEGGNILHTINGGVSFVDEKMINGIPADYILNQNHPNPFNPSTRIEYAIPHTSNVEIKVFDVLGNELETLVNEEKPTGTYEITWHAESLPSGVYFCQLQAGSFIETKKMVLMK